MKSPISSGREQNPASLIHLSLANMQLTEFSELRQYKNLVELDLQGNKFSSKLPELLYLRFIKNLNLSNNNIQKIYALNPQLEHLNLSNNRIGDLSIVLPQLTHLVSLDLSFNCIRSLQGLEGTKPDLKKLVLRNNQIDEITGVETFFNLQDLDLSNNQLKSISTLRNLQSLMRLKNVLLRNNEVTNSKE